MSARLVTHHLPDEGTRYLPGEAVAVVHGTGRVQLVKDANGPYEVVGCRPATEYAAGPMATRPLLRVDLRRRDPDDGRDDTLPSFA